MNYTPTDWKTGDLITAEKLNNMESGIAGGQELFIIHATGIANEPGTQTTPVIDKTHEEIIDAIQHGKMLFMFASSSEQSQNFTVIPFSSLTGQPDQIVMFVNSQLIYTGSTNYMGYMAVMVGQSEVGETMCMSMYERVKIPTDSTPS